MVEDSDKEDEVKLEFDSAGQAIAYISLDQARVLALQHARDNREFYGRYADQELVWAEVGAEESEDYYRIQLSYRPARGFRGRPGIEQITIDKAGLIELRQILSEPRPSRVYVFGLVAVGILILGGAVGGLFAAGILPRSPVDLPEPPTPAISVAGHSETAGP